MKLFYWWNFFDICHNFRWNLYHIIFNIFFSQILYIRNQWVDMDQIFGYHCKINKLKWFCWWLFFDITQIHRIKAVLFHFEHNLNIIKKIYLNHEPARRLISTWSYWNLSEFIWHLFKFLGYFGSYVRNLKTLFLFDKYGSCRKNVIYKIIFFFLTVIS